MTKEELAGKIERMMQLYIKSDDKKRRELSPIIEEVALRYKELTGTPYVFIWEEGSERNKLKSNFEDKLKLRYEEAEDDEDDNRGIPL